MTSQPILISRANAITTITLNRPDKRNALNVELIEQLCAAVAETEADASQRIVLLRGAGKVFCSGLDLAEASQPDRASISADLVGRALRALGTTRLVSIAVVQ